MVRVGRPKKEEQVAINLRNMEIWEKSKKYPIEYLITYYTLSRSRISRIIKKVEENINKKNL